MRWDIVRQLGEWPSWIVRRAPGVRVYASAELLV